jgi:hypothetical protein
VLMVAGKGFDSPTRYTQFVAQSFEGHLLSRWPSLQIEHLVL